MITVRGTARPVGFQSYSIQVIRADGTPLSPAKITLTNGGLQPVTNDVLGAWDTTGVPAGHYRVVLKVLIESSDVRKVLLENSRQISEESRVLVDPTFHPGWPKNLGILGSGGWSYSFMDHLNAVDVNGDGKADLPVAYGSSVRIFDHTGAMLPGWPQSVPFIQTGPTVGDLDGDGSPEVISSLGSTSIWSSKGVLMPGWPKYTGVQGGVTLADLQQDGSKEIIGTAWRMVTVLDKTGAVLPGWPRGRLGPGLGRVAAGDVDLDGKKEIAVAGRLTPNNLYLLGADGKILPGWPIAISPSLPANYLHDADPALGDLDGDRDLEVVIGSWDGKVYAFHHDGTVVAGWPQKTKPVEVNSVVIGDVDGDRRPEVVAGDATNFLYAWHGDGSLLAGWPVTHSSGGGWGYSYFGFGTPALADVDGDGKAEIIVSSDSFSGPNHFALHAYRYDGNEAVGFPKPTASIGAFQTNSAAVADMDGDGLLELAWVDYDTNLYLWDLPAPASSPKPWPMFRQDPGHMGCAAYWAPGDTTPPTVSISSPHDGAKLGRPTAFVRVSARAKDNVGVAGVQFKLDGVNLMAEDKTAPYSVDWGIRRVPNGPHTLSAVARDAAGNTATSAPVSVTVFNDWVRPRVSIISPANRSGVYPGGTVTINVSASDNVGVIGVQFYVSGRRLAFDPTAPYSATWQVPATALPNSPYILVAVAQDAAGNWAISRPVWVYVKYKGWRQR